MSYIPRRLRARAQSEGEYALQVWRLRVRMAEIKRSLGNVVAEAALGMFRQVKP